MEFVYVRNLDIFWSLNFKNEYNPFNSITLTLFSVLNTFYVNIEVVYTI